MDGPDTPNIFAQKPDRAQRGPDPVAALRRELGSFTAFEEDPDEAWEGEWAPQELEARLALYAAV